MIDHIVKEFLDLTEDQYQEFYTKHKSIFRTPGEFKYWCNHHLDASFLSSIKCPCGKKARYVSSAFGYAPYCSSECSSKYVKDRQALRKKTCLEKYGVDNPAKLKSVQTKMRDTRISRYGTDVLLKNQELKSKMQNTCEEKYGSKFYSQTEDYRQKVKKNSNERYGTDHPSQRNIMHVENLNEGYVRDHFIENGKFKAHEFMNYYNLSDNAMFEYKERFGIIEQNAVDFGKSQKEIFDYIQDFGLDAVFNDRTVIRPKELDIYVPSKHVAIEYDGLMYHSFGYSQNPVFNNVKQEWTNRRYHQNKTLSCEEQGIHLFHIFENEWLDSDKRAIWKSVIKNALGFSERAYARKCIIREVASKESKQFLDKNHLQGSSNSSTRLGLYFEDELVSLMTFGKPRFNKEYEYELLRFCNKKNISVVGGAGKLFKYFLIEYEPKSIISYANRRWSQGKLYENLGFEKIGTTDPNYFYFHSNQKILQNRMSFQKHMLELKLNSFDGTLTESENMYENNYRKIYDCGNFIYAFKRGRAH